MKELDESRFVGQVSRCTFCVFQLDFATFGRSYTIKKHRFCDAFFIGGMKRTFGA